MFEKLTSRYYDGINRRAGGKVRRGMVKWFNNEKGYGFIELGASVNEEDIFVHYSAIEKEGYKTLKEGDVVEFTLIKTNKGCQAVNVKEVKLTTV